jgi:hypothetical protein
MTTRIIRKPVAITAGIIALVLALTFAVAPSAQASYVTQDISGATVTGIAAKTYNGAAQAQNPTVTLDGVTLEKDIDYTLSYSNNVNAGKATVTITGVGIYEGAISRTFTINKAKLSSAALSTNRLAWTGKARTPGVTVRAKLGSANKILVKNRDYTVTAKNNKTVGKATMTIKGKGNFTGTLTRTYQIIPKGVGIKKLTSGNKAFKVQWYRQSAKMSYSRINGYQIRYSSNKLFKSGTVKWKNINGYKNLTKWVNGLQKGKTYYVQVRTFKTVNGVKYYSFWSNSKVVKTKGASSKTTSSSSAATSGTVYWTPGGSVWHVSRGCSTLANSKTVLHGSIAASGKPRVCKVCGG